MNKRLLSPPVCWHSDGMPYSEQFQDIYHTRSGAMEQAQHTFLHATDLPQRWANASQHTILETGFGLGLNFLTTWHLWQEDPKRCLRLHFVSVEAYPVLPDDIIRATQDNPVLQPLAQQLITQYPAPESGIYRLVFEHDFPQQIILTLVFGDARSMIPQLHLQAETVFLDGFSPDKNPQMWENTLLKNIAKQCQPQAHIATWSVAGQLRRNLKDAGFEVQRVPGLPPKRESLIGIYTPKKLTRRTLTNPTVSRPSYENEAIVIGAGLAGTSLCYALSQRGWQVTLIDKATGPGHYASGLPIGLALPYISADDAPLSKLTRCGVHWLKHLIKACQLAPQYWQEMPVEQILKPAELSHHGKKTIESSLFDHRLTDEKQFCRYFHRGLKVEGAPFVRVLLAHSPGLQFLWETEIHHLTYDQGQWQLYDAAHHLCAQAPVVAVCAALNTLPLCSMENKGIQPNRGQMTLGLPSYPLPTEILQARTGNGHFLLPTRADAGWSWSMGSSFTPGCLDTEVSEQSHQENYAKLQTLSAVTAEQLALPFKQGPLGSFVEVRLTSQDHLPLIGAVPNLSALKQLNPKTLHIDDVPQLPGLYMLTALGSRGLAVGPWSAEILASMINHEPWPVSTSLAHSLSPARFELRSMRKPH